MTCGMERVNNDALLELCGVGRHCHWQCALPLRWYVISLFCPCVPVWSGQVDRGAESWLTGCPPQIGVFVLRWQLRSQGVSPKRVWVVWTDQVRNGVFWYSLSTLFPIYWLMNGFAGTIAQLNTANASVLDVL